MTLQRKLQLLLADQKMKVIAKRAGIHPITLGSYVNHGVTPGSDVAVRLADAGVFRLRCAIVANGQKSRDYEYAHGQYGQASRATESSRATE